MALLNVVLIIVRKITSSFNRCEVFFYKNEMSNDQSENSINAYKKIQLFGLFLSFNQLLSFLLKPLLLLLLLHRLLEWTAKGEISINHKSRQNQFLSQKYFLLWLNFLKHFVVCKLDLSASFFPFFLLFLFWLAKEQS